MRLLSLAIIGTLCLGMMPCAQTADPRDERSKPLVTAAATATLVPRPPVKIHGTDDREPQIDPPQPIDPLQPLPPGNRPVLVSRVKTKTILRAETAALSPTNQGVAPTAATRTRDTVQTTHHLAALPTVIDAMPIRLVAAIDKGHPAGPAVALASPEFVAPEHSGAALGAAADQSSWEPSPWTPRPRTHSPCGRTFPPLPEPHASLVDDVATRPNARAVAGSHDEPLVVAGEMELVFRQRVTTGGSKIAPIAGGSPPEIPALAESAQIRSAPNRSPARGRERDSSGRASTRVPDTLRPVSKSRLTTAPEPVGAIPHPMTPVPSRVLYRPQRPTSPADIGNIRSIKIAPTTAIPPNANAAIASPPIEPPETPDRVGNVRHVDHHADHADGESPDVKIADLIVGSLPQSTRRVAQVVAQSDEDETLAVPPLELTTPPTAPKGFAIPLQPAPGTDRATLEKHEDLVTLVATDAELRSVLRMIADHHKLNLVIGPDVAGPVTISIRGARLDEVLDAILGVAGFHWHQSDNLLYVTGSEAATLDPKVQGRRLQVYPLNYIAAADVQTVVTGLLSPVGKAYTSEADSVDQLKTRELLIVEDNEAGHLRISQYIAQVDIPPRQVLVEAHVLQIDLNDEERHGVNLRALARISGAKVVLEGSNFAEETPEGPSLAFRINGTDVGHLIEAIHVNTNSRTLASPKVSVVNRQTAKVQIGQRLPYAVATTTQTATIQNVQFLDVGIVLEVTPVITQDGNILMTVLPKVSGGKITESGFPEEDTTQVSTTVLMPDGSGLVIGGLIRETDSQTDATVPVVGKIPVIKRLFNKRAAETRRNELVVALVTHIMHEPSPVREKECLDLQTALPPHAARELRYPPEIRYSNH